MATFSPGRHGVFFAKDWTDSSTLPVGTDEQYSLREDELDIVIFGDCFLCLENGCETARQLDLSWVRLSECSESENVKTSEMLCPCSSHGGSHPVGVESIFVRFHKDVTLKTFMKAQCFNCQRKTNPIPPPHCHPLNEWHRMSFMPCCQAPQIKFVSLKFEISLRQSPPASLMLEDIQETVQAVCFICFMSIASKAMSCADCAEAYHDNCYQSWRAFRKRCSRDWCLSCRGDVKRTPLLDLNSRRKVIRSSKQRRLDSENMPPPSSIFIPKSKVQHKPSPTPSLNSACAHSTADVCFLVDCTGSMDEWIDAARDSVYDIAFKASCISNTSCRFGFVGYRDFDQEPANRYSVLDFTTNFNGFSRFLMNVQAVGGMDECEDLLGGLSRALQLSWRSEVRTIYLVCDAPCHGLDYHFGFAYDDHPLVPPELHALPQFRRMQAAKIFLHGFKVGTIQKHSNHVMIMMRRFREIWKSITGHNFPIQDLMDQTSLLSDSVSGSLHNIAQRAREDPLKLNIQGLLSDLDSQSPVLEGSRGSFSVSAEPNFSEGPKFGSLTFSNTRMQIASAYFSADGSNKYVFHCKEHHIPTPLVAKVYNTKQRVSNQAAYLCELHLNFRARYFADAFNATRATNIYIVPVKQLYFRLHNPSLKHHQLQHYLIEEYLAGDLVKFNSNGGWVHPDAAYSGVEEVAQAFSHFTYKHSNFKEIFVDIQGQSSAERLVVFDLACHTSDGRVDLEPMNWGQQGIEAFFKTHKCGETCQKLNLNRIVPLISNSTVDLPVVETSLLAPVGPLVRGNGNDLQSIGEDEDDDV